MVHPIVASERNQSTEEQSFGAGHLLYIFPLVFGQGCFRVRPYSTVKLKKTETVQTSRISRWLF